MSFIVIGSSSSSLMQKKQQQRHPATERNMNNSLKVNSIFRNMTLSMESKNENSSCFKITRSNTLLLLTVCHLNDSYDDNYDDDDSIFSLEMYSCTFVQWKGVKMHHFWRNSQRIYPSFSQLWQTDWLWILTVQSIGTWTFFIRINGR